MGALLLAQPRAALDGQLYWYAASAAAAPCENAAFEYLKHVADADVTRCSTARAACSRSVLTHVTENRERRLSLCAAALRGR